MRNVALTSTDDDDDDGGDYKSCAIIISSINDKQARQRM